MSPLQVVVMIHGVRNERRSLLLPYIGYAIVAILAGCAQVRLANLMAIFGRKTRLYFFAHFSLAPTF